MDDGETDIIITEVGGTVGDIESQPYLEAIRQVAAEKGRENVLYIHVPLVVSIPGTGELKSKPTQHSVKELLSVAFSRIFWCAAPTVPCRRTCGGRSPCSATWRRTALSRI